MAQLCRPLVETQARLSAPWEPPSVGPLAAPPPNLFLRPHLLALCVSASPSHGAPVTHVSSFQNHLPSFAGNVDSRGRPYVWPGVTRLLVCVLFLRFPPTLCIQVCSFGAITGTKSYWAPKQQTCLLSKCWMSEAKLWAGRAPSEGQEEKLQETPAGRGWRACAAPTFTGFLLGPEGLPAGFIWSIHHVPRWPGGWHYCSCS